MKNLKKLLLFFYLVSLISCDYSEPEKELNPSLVLWYDKPANGQQSCCLLENGRLGAMVYGGKTTDTIQFNEETLWSGQPHDYAHPGTSQYLGEIRNLLWSGKQEEATNGQPKFMSQPFGQQCYQPFGNILLSFSGRKCNKL